MKRIEFTGVTPPIDPNSAVTEQRYYTVYLGNRNTVMFTSDRHAQAFSAETERFLSQQLYEANSLLAEAFAAIRYTWPTLAHNKPSMTQELVKLEALLKNNVMDAWAAMDRAISQGNTPNALVLCWRHVTTATNCIRNVAIALRDRNIRTNPVERYRMEVLLKRSNAVLQALKDYGADVPNAVKIRNPY